MPTQNLLKGTTIYPTLNLSAQANSADDDGKSYNVYKGSFMVSAITPPPPIPPPGASIGLVGSYLSSTSNCFTFPDFSGNTNIRNIKTLNLQLTQISYSDVDTSTTPNYESRFANITITTSYNTPTNTWISFYSESPSTDSPQQLGDDPFPIDWGACVIYDSGKFHFKISRLAGSTDKLQQLVRGIYTLY